MEFGTKSGGVGFLVIILVFVLVEAGILAFQKNKVYPWKEAVASFGVATIKRMIDFMTVGIAAGILFLAYNYRLNTFNLDTVLDGVVFFFALEFSYYWHHRWAHEVRWLWATHSVHHSPEHMNLSVASRLGVTGVISGSALFFAPLAWLGYHPVLIFLGLAASLFYQIWLHTELVGKLGPLEWVFNTPSHHRVHHASNLEYIDKNYGGVLIIFDRIFGTFAKENKQPRYGLVKPHRSYNPFVIAFYEWWQIVKDVRKAKSLKSVFCYMFSRPGWKPEPMDSDLERFEKEMRDVRP